MFATRVYFSLSEITDPTKHRDHNEWHQLDHQPENLLLPGVALGSRWVRSPDCAALSTGTAASYMAAHYGIMYWFREPMAETLDDFFELSERSFQWGRSPQIGWTRRPMRGFFAPLKGYVAPRVRVSVEALPYRPVKAVLIKLSNLRGSERSEPPRCAGRMRSTFPPLSHAKASLAHGHLRPTSCSRRHGTTAARAGASPTRRAAPRTRNRSACRFFISTTNQRR